MSARIPPKRSWKPIHPYPLTLPPKEYPWQKQGLSWKQKMWELVKYELKQIVR